MPVTVVETGNSRGGTDTALSREYDVYGTTDEVTAAGAALAATPISLAAGVLRYSGMSLEEINDQDPRGGHYLVTVHYSSGGNVVPEVDSFEYRFSFQAPSAHIYQSLATISSTAASGSPTNHKGAINVVNDSGGQRVEGWNLAPPPETFTLIYHPASGQLTQTWFDTVESLVGLASSVAYKGRPAGSLMLSRVTGGAIDGLVGAIEFGYAYVQNRTSIPVGDITVASKDGMDLLWVEYKRAKDDTAKTLASVPKSAYVERIWYRGDFNLLGI